MKPALPLNGNPFSLLTTPTGWVWDFQQDTKPPILRRIMEFELATASALVRVDNTALLPANVRVMNKSDDPVSIKPDGTIEVTASVLAPVHVTNNVVEPLYVIVEA